MVGPDVWIYIFLVWAGDTRSLKGMDSRSPCAQWSSLQNGAANLISGQEGCNARSQMVTYSVTKSSMPIATPLRYPR